MRHWMSAQAEKSRTRHRHARWQARRARRAATSCPLKVALRTDVRSWAARIRRTTDHTGAASPAHAGPGRDGVVHRDWLGHPDLQTMRSQPWCAVRKPILHPHWPAEGRSARQATVARRCCPRRALCSEAQRQLSAGASRRCPFRGGTRHHRQAGTASRPGRAVMPVEGGRCRRPSP
jgi:hypothetical protein